MIEQNYVYASDERYASKLAVSMRSLIKSQRKAMNSAIINIHVLSNGLTEKSVLRLRSISSGFENINISFYDLDTLNSLLPSNLYIGNLSIATYSRLFIPRLFDNKDRILYLDTDIIIDSDLSELFSLDMTGFCIGGVQAVLEKDSEEFSINAGVTLWNIPFCNSENLFSRFMDYLSEKGAQVAFHDQTVINQVTASKIMKLPLKYNTTTPIFLYEYKRFISIFNLSDFYSEQEYSFARKSPAIIHLTGWTTGRPWQKGNWHPYTDLYDKYAAELGIESIDPSIGFNVRTNMIRNLFYKYAPQKIVIQYRKGK